MTQHTSIHKKTGLSPTVTSKVKKGKGKEDITNTLPTRIQTRRVVKSSFKNELQSTILEH